MEQTGERERGPKQSSPLENLLERYVEIVSTDGRVFVGKEHFPLLFL